MDIGDIPKSTLKINGVPIIRQTVEMLLRAGAEVTLCVGYKYKLIMDALDGLDVRYAYNPFYNVTNNIGSLWFSRDEMYADDILMMSADLMFPKGILDKVIGESGDLVMSVDTSRTRDGDYFFEIDSRGRVVSYGPDVPLEKRYCEYMGVSKISSGFVDRFREKLITMVDSGDYMDYFEKIFLSFSNDMTCDFHLLDISEFQWREIDFYKDYCKAKEQFGGRESAQ